MLYNYKNDNIINYCKGKDVILYTGDNEMASTAKGYKIKYILAETEEEEISTETSEKEEIMIRIKIYFYQILCWCVLIISC